MDREQHLQKRKPVQSPRVSASLGPSPAVSSKSGEFSSGSFGPQFNTVAMSTAFGSSQKEKATTISSAVAGGAPSVASSPGDSIPRQQPATTAAKRRSNSLPKTPSTSGVGSPASVGNMSVPLSASSPPVGSPCLADQAILERFSKIEMVTMRHGLNVKKNKVDDYPVHRATGYSTELLSSHLSSASSSEDFKDSSCRWPLSKSLVGGSMNVRKIRVMDFVHGERRLQGNMVTFIPKVRRRLIMSEKQNDGTVAMRYGEPDDSDPLASEDYLPTLPTTHYADSLAAQFTALMTREGYQYDDHVQPKPAASFSSSQPNVSGVAVEIQQHPNNVPRQPSGAVATPVTSGNPFMNQTQNHLPGTRVLPHGNNQGLQMSQGLMPGAAVPPNLAQQLDSQGSLQQQQQQQQNQMPQIQQHAQLQRPSMMLPGNSLSHLNAIGQNSNVQLGTAMGLGNMGNNMVGLSGIGNIMGLGSVRGIGGAGMSSPMGPMSGMGNMGQNPMSLSQASNFSNVINQHFRSGNINPAQVAAMAKLRMVQNRTGILGGPQSGIAGMSGAGHMHPGSAALPPMSTASAGAPPASPQLSSQTLGSVGSMTSSPMELQGVNKSNSVGNV
ncbi:hypothetical protein Syun_026633 [Stephania yunnanensis]|uniref:PHL domain-containing protein n=1 Tax=Stephania yunnanensis TaxID=152371 RepID=A0AAP0EZG0_9MAGN